MSKQIDADKLKSVFNYLCEQKNVDMITLEAVEAIIDTAPTVSQWIPCSERLPEEYDELLVTYKEDEQIKPLIEIMEYEPHYDYNNGEWIGKWVYDGITDVNVLAWMPLPEPYKEETK